MRCFKQKERVFTAAAGAALFFATACIPLPGGSGNPSIVIQASGADEEKKDKKKLKRSRSELRGEYFANSRSEACNKNRDCRDICADLYSDDYGAQDECFKLKTTAVEDMDAVISVLEDPSIGELKNIDHKMFDILLEISVEPWVAAARRADRKEAGIILAWIAQSREIASAVLDHGSTGDYVGYESYAGFKELLKAVARDGANDCDKYLFGLTADLNDSNYSFCGIAKRENNVKVTKLTPAEDGILGGFNEECSAELDKKFTAGPLPAETPAQKAARDAHAAELQRDCKFQP